MQRRPHPKSRVLAFQYVEQLDLAVSITAAFVVVAVSGMGVLLIMHLRTRRQLRELLERVNEIEPLPSEAGEDEVASTMPDAGRKTPTYGFTPARDPSQDVLAGRTSFVRRATSDRPQGPLSLAMLAIRRIDARIEDAISPAELAQELDVSLRTLERRLAFELGCTPRQLILVIKMREAGRMLAGGRYRVAEVASRLGFATPSHFSRCFRTFYGMPPSAARPQPPA